MAVKLFVLGLPGSGKSTVARYITTYAKDRQWPTAHFNDYGILQGMFRDDIENKQFKPADHGGFDVLDLTVFDIALHKLEQAVKNHILSVNSGELILIEFARNDYLRAFHQFCKASFLKDAYFLYLDTDIETCKGRIRERITNPTTLDDHFVSEYIFSAYYNTDNGKDIPHILEGDFGIDRQRVKVIDNKRSLQEASESINPFIDSIFVSSSTSLGTIAIQETLAGIS